MADRRSQTVQLDLTPDQVMQMLQAPGIARLYANGFTIVQSASDISVLMMHNNVPTGLLTMSLISAKSLATDLLKATKDFETATKTKVRTISELIPLLKQNE